MIINRYRTVPSVSPVVKELEKLASAASMWGHPSGGGEAIYLGPLEWGEPYFDGPSCCCDWVTRAMPGAWINSAEVRTRDGKVLPVAVVLDGLLPVETRGRTFYGTFSARGKSSPAGLLSKVRDVMAGLDWPEELRQ
jgi:hypothetical protein